MTKEVLMNHLNVIAKKDKLLRLRASYLSLFLLPIMTFGLSFVCFVISQLLDVLYGAYITLKVTTYVSIILAILFRKGTKEDIKEAKKELEIALHELEEAKKPKCIEEVNSKDYLYVNVDGLYNLNKYQIIQDDLSIKKVVSSEDSRYGLKRNEIIQDDLSIPSKVKKLTK